jgi:hypothetical protein
VAEGVAGDVVLADYSFYTPPSGSPHQIQIPRYRRLFPCDHLLLLLPHRILLPLPPNTPRPRLLQQLRSPTPPILRSTPRHLLQQLQLPLLLSPALIPAPRIAPLQSRARLTILPISVSQSVVLRAFGVEAEESVGDAATQQLADFVGLQGGDYALALVDEVVQREPFLLVFYFGEDWAD